MIIIHQIDLDTDNEEIAELVAVINDRLRQIQDDLNREMMSIADQTYR